MYKSQLQELVQKAQWKAPEYECFKQGPAHSPIFKGAVVVNGVRYESPQCFATVKAAEHAAAKCALDSLSSNCGIECHPLHHSGLCKNLLQDYAQKIRCALPKYTTMRYGKDHEPLFTSTVEIAGMYYAGGAASSKKEAEIKAARTALVALGDVCIGGSRKRPRNIDRDGDGEDVQDSRRRKRV